MQQQQKHPALVSLLEECPDVWSGVLFPKLVAAKSAGNCALTCSRLRQLCQGSQRQLNLARLDSSEGSRAFDALPERFTSCNTVKFALCTETSYAATPALTDALARLPTLTTITLTVEGRQAVGLTKAVGMMGRQLPHLRCLILAPKQSWAQAQDVWEQLGSMTQLTSLIIKFGGSVQSACSLQNLQPLRSLTGLRGLAIRAAPILQQQDAQQEQQDDDQPGLEFLGALKALTQLNLPVLTSRGFSSISSCTQLLVLCLDTTGQHLDLSAADWEALGGLTQLTSFSLCERLARAAEQQVQLYDALRKLTRLKSVHCAHDSWTPAVLPVFTALPSLRVVRGGWLCPDDASALGSVQCASVTALRSLSGKVPFGAFPSLTFIDLTYFGMSAASWQALGSSCPGLKHVHRDWQLKLRPLIGSFTTSVDDDDNALRVAALRSLSSLTALTKLVFFPERRCDLAALAESLPPQLQQLELVCSGRPGDMEGGCWGALMALGKLTSLRALMVVVRDVLEDPVQAQLFLSAVSHVPEVRVAGMGQRMSEVLAGHRRLGLQLPAKLTIKQLPANGW